MTQNTETLDKWRSFFWSSNSDIFNIIENAILVAALDHPRNFRSKRDQIAEALFSCTSTKNIGSNHVEVSKDGPEEDYKSGLERESGVISNDISKVISNDPVGINVNKDSMCSVEALSYELDEEHRIIGEILRIKKILESKHEESETVLLDSLRQLQWMDISVGKLEATKIGKTVNLLRKHCSEKISLLSKALIISWKNTANDQWSIAKQAIAEAADTPESVNPPGVEVGLPSPPLDEGAFFMSPLADLDLFKFFDGLEDCGNFYHIDDPMILEPEPKNQAALMKPKTATTKRKINVDQKAKNGAKIKQKNENISIQDRPITCHEEKPKIVDHDRKFKDTKRKVRENCQQIQKAKKQRTIQGMDLKDIPKQGLGQSNASRNRHSVAHGRH